MKVIEMRKTGEPEVLTLTERAVPALSSPTGLLVRLKAAGINPVDTKLRARGVLVPDGLPAVLGCDGAGVVEAVGERVSRFKPGDPVWFCHGGLGGPEGNYAEYALVDEGIAQPKPRTLDFIHAAAAPLVLITAWEALYDHADLAEGKRVLIHAGAGGVGHVAIQLARLAGARVCTTVSNPRKAELVRALGAECVINYQEEDLVAAVMDWTGGKGMDMALDTVGPAVFAQTVPAMAYRGNLVTILQPGPDQDWKEVRGRNLRISFEWMLAPMLREQPAARAHQGEILRRCAQWIDSGELRIQVSETFPLEQVAVAHNRIEAGHTEGKLVLTME
ncbi:zinc-dependent alcohol dehydrogenase family protein [Candidatus Thiosymbion oneisti]|uniref:zinc-dependent alcohol dehydrogenase family protein n=1 Tax=Candidatus Thiosymbion oneisti TaxID=589554 RepID=UPI000B32F783|nr:zinc-dependent alcohol dehydrogenase family protein [Candidatus Thiosymbion oneisti]